MKIVISASWEFGWHISSHHPGVEILQYTKPFYQLDTITNVPGPKWVVMSWENYFIHRKSFIH